jgi:hypothetical protein
MINLSTALQEEGFAIRPAAAMAAWLKWSRPDWARFAASWNDLGEDRYMGDGGRYRRRRYAVFDITGDRIARAPHQPHFQSEIYNRLNGGLERWFEPVMPQIGDNPIVQTLLRRLSVLFQGMVLKDGTDFNWHVEIHQFRIEVCAGTVGRPTPEGVHRDGVDGAFVMLVNRDNVASGVTGIFDATGRPLGSFTLADRGDAAFLDDRRVYHGVTPIAPLDPDRPAIRDVLVITFTRRRTSADADHKPA